MEEKNSPLSIGIRLHNVRCPHTLDIEGKKWNGKCPYGGTCKDPNLDLVFLGNYCRQKGATIEAMENLSTDLYKD